LLHLKFIALQGALVLKMVQVSSAAEAP